jgi:uncharacterized membrane protein
MCCLAGTAVVLSVRQGIVWQRQIYYLTGLPPPSTWGYASVPTVAAAIVAALTAAGRGLLAGGRAVEEALRRRVSRPVWRVAATFTVVTLLFTAAPEVLQAWGERVFRSGGERPPASALGPADPAVSGSPQSLVSWHSLGPWGQEFVTAEPTVGQLTAFNGRPAMQPVRVYIGLDAAPTIGQRAALAVQELERTRAFDRQVLCLVTTTGTGWVDQRSVVPLEYMFNGDTATVALQYSNLPSVLSFLTGPDQVPRAAGELITQVHDRWAQLPAGRRPKLLIFGESLGAYGTDRAFTDVPDILARSDGALFVGSPNSSPLWRHLVSARDAGTTEIAPVYRGGRDVRFGTPAGLTPQFATWARPRVVYLQHPSDPVVWCSPRLLLRRPDWMAEPRGHDVLAAVRWYPIITFVQLTADLAFANRVSPGHGHNYRGEAVDAWALITNPAGWTESRAAALRMIMQR